MSRQEITPGAKFRIDANFELSVFEEIYPFTEVTGRALYRVREVKTLLFYALKVFDLKFNSKEEIEKEIISLNSFDFDYISPKCRSFSVDQGQGLLLMDWIEGKTLAQNYSSLPRDYYELKDRVQVLQDLCRAVEKIHSRKVFHRDLKPENIIISSGRGPGSKVRLIDFGMSNIQRPKSGAEGGSFRAPEQDTRRDFNLRAQVDIFAIGKIGWWLLTGIIPQLYEDEETVADWDNLDDIDLCQQCPVATKSLESVLKVAMAYKPEKRHRSARQLENALKHCQLKEG